MSDPTLHNVRVVMVAITKHGAKQAAALAPALPNAHILASEKVAAELGSPSNPTRIYTGAMKDEIAAIFANYDQLIFFVSLGVVVRMIAPYMKSKDEDPGVLVVDDAGQFVIPVLSGHVGGANACAEQLADLIGATPVLTTASDVGKTIPVDILGRGLGWKLEAPKINVTRVSADVVNGELIAFVQEAGSPHWWTRPTPLPDNIHLFADFSAVDLQRYRSVLWVTHAEIPDATWEQLKERLVVYRPPVESL
ncbi:MAG: cobalamin biosynthesis central domain-containing protein [Pseudomonadales bacterium]